MGLGEECEGRRDRDGQREGQSGGKENIKIIGLLIFVLEKLLQWNSDICKCSGPAKSLAYIRVAYIRKLAYMQI